MRPFIGFSTDRAKAIRVPEGFFDDVLPQISSVLEMKVLLYLFWRLARTSPGGPSPRMVSLEELEEDERLRSVLAQSKGPRAYEEALREGLELCVARGTLLQLWVREESEQSDAGAGKPGSAAADLWYVLNTRESRVWIEALGRGEVDVLETPLAERYRVEYSTSNDANNAHRLPAADYRQLRFIAERPSIYALYEQNIGLLTPILAEQLQEAERRFPKEWIEAAFQEAAINNKRSWRYIERILERWAAEGKESGKARGSDGRSLDPDKYTKGKYAFLFRPERSG